jgi:hypothetical protein
MIDGVGLFFDKMSFRLRSEATADKQGSEFRVLGWFENRAAKHG